MWALWHAVFPCEFGALLPAIEKELVEARRAAVSGKPARPEWALSELARPQTRRELTGLFVASHAGLTQALPAIDRCGRPENTKGRPKGSLVLHAPLSPSHPDPQEDGAVRTCLCFVAGLGRGGMGLKPGH